MTPSRIAYRARKRTIAHKLAIAAAISATSSGLILLAAIFMGVL